MPLQHPRNRRPRRDGPTPVRSFRHIHRLVGSRLLRRGRWYIAGSLPHRGGGAALDGRQGQETWQFDFANDPLLKTPDSRRPDYTVFYEGGVGRVT